jgi:hypothetical protein
MAQKNNIGFWPFLESIILHRQHSLENVRLLSCAPLLGLLKTVKFKLVMENLTMEKKMFLLECSENMKHPLSTSSKSFNVHQH